MAYSTLDRERGLTALAITGVAAQAAKMTGIGASAIERWSHEHADRYAVILASRAKLIDQACIDEFRTIVLEAAQASALAVREERRRIEVQPHTIRDPAQTGLNLARTAALLSEKVALMEGRPTAILEHRSADDALRALDKRGVIVDGDAEEIPPVVEIEATVASV